MDAKTILSHIITSALFHRYTTQLRIEEIRSTEGDTAELLTLYQIVKDTNKIIDDASHNRAMLTRHGGTIK
jgi:hypothetical protein